MSEKKYCADCKYENVDLDDYPCAECRIVMHNNKWEAKEEE